jgi:NADP-reducing hydrogenase subunit HndB
MRLSSIDDLKNLRDRLEEKQRLKANHDTVITVGMGTCGLAAGAKEVYWAILKEVKKRNLQITVKETGCLGLCEQEVLVEVACPGRKKILYGKVKPGDVPKLFGEHIVNGNVASELVVVGKAG